ncbi:MAG TPA: putative metal-binding motif-containing protein, partial [bacterium]|nr:putative metal-binding motif-containing protein [bacterium]
MSEQINKSSSQIDIAHAVKREFSDLPAGQAYDSFPQDSYLPPVNAPWHESWYAGPAGDVIKYGLYALAAPVLLVGALGGCNHSADDTDTPDPEATPKDNDDDGFESCDSYAEGTEDHAECVSLLDGDADCNDANATIHPGATETCDGIDQDCDASIDEGLTLYTLYHDGDADS